MRVPSNLNTHNLNARFGSQVRIMVRHWFHLPPLFPMTSLANMESNPTIMNATVAT